MTRSSRRTLAAIPSLSSTSARFCSDSRLRETLGVTEPDPRAALARTVEWLWEHDAEHYPDHLAASTPTARGPEKGAWRAGN